VIRPKYITKAKRSIKKAFTYQIENRCFSMVELISTCPTNWGMTPQESIDWAETNLLEYYKLGEYKSPESTEEA
jgi:2-oxoglutarate ferredoxin oxidoreductase subunit beta